jgi:hypothetical protein
MKLQRFILDQCLFNKSSKCVKVRKVTQTTNSPEGYMATDGFYEVVGPVGKAGVREITPAPPLAEFEGKKIAFIWTIFTNGDVLADALSEVLHRRYPGLQTIKLPGGKKTKWGDYADESIKDVAREAGVDAAIVLVGG